jgi:tetratricopeptide (TPR) repeat protein
MLDYDFPISNSFFELRTLISFILLLSLFILAIFLYKNYRLISFGIFWFFLTLSVEASFIPIPNLIFEHRTYLPSFGFFLILSSVVYTLIGEKHKFLSIVLLVIIIGVNSCLTYERNKVWKDEFSLCNDNVKKAPNSARAASSRGDVYSERGQYDNAIADYSRAIEVNPYYAEAYSNRGAAYLITQQWGKAIADLSKAISINPGLIDAYTNRGITYGKINQWDSALVDFSRVIVINPNISKAYYNRGNTYSKLGLWDNAITDYSKMINMGTMDERVYAYRGIAFSQLKQWDKAIVDYSKALEINPYFELANTQREIAYKNLNSSKH